MGVMGGMFFLVEVEYLVIGCVFDFFVIDDVDVFVKFDEVIGGKLLVECFEIVMKWIICNFICDVDGIYIELVFDIGNILVGLESYLLVEVEMELKFGFSFVLFEVVK